MISLALATLLTGTSVSAPVAVEAAAPEPERPHDREFRFAAGAGAIESLYGKAATAEIGVEVDPWDRVGFRVTVGGTMRYTWGMLSVTPEVMLRATPLRARVSPWLSAGIQVGALEVTEEARTGAAALPLRSRASVTDDPGERIAAALRGTMPFSLSVGPQVAAGVALRIAPELSVDLVARSTLVRLDGDWLVALGGVVALCGPF